MRGQVPEHVDIGLHQPEVIGTEFHELELAQLPATDHLPDTSYRRREAVGVGRR